MNRFFRSESESMCTDLELIVELEQNHIPLLALEIALLITGLSEKLTFASRTGPNIKLHIKKFSYDNDRASFEEQSDAISVEISKNQAEYIYVFLLKSYRDGFAEVNHIHIEGLMDGKHHDLTFLFEKYLEPMTSEQAEKLMKG